MVKPNENKYLFSIKRIDGLLNEQRLKEKIKIILRFFHPFYCNWKAWSNFFTKVISQEIAKIKKKEAKDQVARPFYILGRDMCQEQCRPTFSSAIWSPCWQNVSLSCFPRRHPCSNQSLIGCWNQGSFVPVVDKPLTHLKNNLCYRISSLLMAMLVLWRSPTSSTFVRYCEESWWRFSPTLSRIDETWTRHWIRSSNDLSASENIRSQRLPRSLSAQKTF